ncbi:MAG: carbohydrate kinase family protein [Spirochaetales bacterium]|mgnify:CR=1 FL=1|nr:carbohydrate kinase family protein [Spirochaetales bacterium]
MSRRSVLVIGPMFADLLVEGASQMPRAGEERYIDSYTVSPGGNAILALAFARLGLHSALLTTIGDDFIGAELRDSLETEGVDTSTLSVIENQQSNISLIFHDASDRSFLTWVQPDLLVHEYASAVARRIASDRYDHVHICFEYLSHRWARDLLKRLRRSGSGISTGLGYQDSVSWNQESVEQAALVDWIFMNEEEARRITGKRDVQDLLHALREIVREPVVTLGREGSVALSEEGETIRVPAVDVAVVNTTGSGDSFAAGFIYALLRKRSLMECVQTGGLFGSMTASVKESISPRIGPELAERLEDYYGS